VRRSIEAADGSRAVSIELRRGRSPEIAFDPDALHNVVDNLVDNAEKFSRDVPDHSISVDVAAEDGGAADRW
jgi:signal transduction histidine kinase